MLSSGSPHTRMITWLLILFSFYIVYAALLWFAQRAVMFPGAQRATSRAQSDAAGERTAWVGLEERVEVVFLSPEGPTPAPALVFAYGNGEHLDMWRWEFSILQRQGYAVLLVEYPGYGRSQGQPSKRSIERTMRLAYDHLVAQPEVDAKRVIGYGRSLGGAAVCALSEQRPLAALILESSFSSVAAIARRYGLWAFLVRDPFDNVRALERFQRPALILHGTNDRVIPVSHAHALVQAAGQGELVLMACGHNDCPRPWGRILQFLRERGLSPIVK